MHIMRRRFFRVAPSARVFVVAFVLLAIIGIAVFSLKKSGFLAKEPETKKIILTESRQTDEIKKLNEDPDGDGLKNWEEQIFGTDPNKADTDGDGMNDGDEIKQGRDPAKPGPDDALMPPGSEEDIKKSLTRQPVNLTADFAARFLKDPVRQIIAGETPAIDEIGVGNYAEKLLSRSVLASAPEIGEKDIKTVQDNGPEALEAYFLEFTNIFNRLQSRGENELRITMDVFENQEYDKLEKLEEYGYIYARTISDLQALPAPSALKSFHLAILNYISKFKFAVELMRNMEQDPIQTMLAITERVNIEKELEAFLAKSQQDILAQFVR